MCRLGCLTAPLHVLQCKGYEYWMPWQEKRPPVHVAPKALPHDLEEQAKTQAEALSGQSSGADLVAAQRKAPRSHYRVHFTHE